MNDYSYATIQQERLLNKEIKNLPWGGRDPVLDTPEKQLFFTLFYLKTYPTFDVLGFHFGLSADHARDYLVFFLRVLNLRGCPKTTSRLKIHNYSICIGFGYQ